MTDCGMLCTSSFGYMAHQIESLFNIGGKTIKQIYICKKSGG